MRRFRALVLAAVLALTLAGCGRQDRPQSGKLNVVCTLFPYYDFVRQIGGDAVDVQLLVPAGRETHSFEPTPLDVIAVSEAEVFLYNGGESELWVEDILDAAAESGDLKAAVDAANENRDENSQLSASETTYGADSTTPAEEVRTAADALKDGELAEIVDTDTGYYAVQMVSTFDEDATANKKDSIVTERKNPLYQEKCTELEEQHSFDIKDDVLAELTFDRIYTLNTGSTEE